MTAGPIVLGVAGDSSKDKLIQMLLRAFTDRGISAYVSIGTGPDTFLRAAGFKVAICTQDVEDECEWYTKTDNAYFLLADATEDGLFCFRKGDKNWDWKLDFILDNLFPSKALT